MPSALDRRGRVLIAVIVLAAVGLIIARTVISRRPRPGPDNCIGTPDSSTVLVFDRSEGISRQTLDEMKARAIAFIRDNVRVNERVTVFTVDDSSTYSLRPLVSVCRPRRTGSELTENTRLLQRQYEQRFEQPIDSALSMIAGDGRRSPIAQALTDISLSQYLGRSKNALLVFSDLLENTDRYSLYRCEAAGRVIQEFRKSRAGARERPSFRNTHVYLHVIPRLDYPEEVWRCRDTLWLWFFGDNEGPDAAVDVLFLPGGPPAPRPQ
jgi:hypothetical protein